MFKRYSCVLQKDEKDCGPACILTIAKHYGTGFSLAKLRDISGTDMNGTNIVGMIKGLNYLDFDVKAVKVEDKKIDNSVSLPLIAHIHTERDFLHYVVVHEINKNGIIVADPEKGVVKYTYEEFTTLWTGILLLIEPMKKFEKKQKNESSLLRFFGFLKNHKPLLWNIFLVSVLYTILGLGSSFYTKYLVDYVLKDQLVNTLNILMAGVIILNLVQVFLGIFRQYLLLYLSKKIEISILLGYYNHLIKLPMKFFSARKTGEITSRFDDADDINETVIDTILSLMLDTIMAVGGAVILIVQNPFLFFVSVVMLLSYVITILLFIKPMKKINNEALENQSQLESLLIQSISGIETIKSYNLEEYNKNEVEFNYLKVLKSTFKSNKINVIAGTISEIITLFGNMIIMWIGAYQVIQNKLSLGELMVFNTLLGYFMEPAKNLIGLLSNLQTAVVSAERVGEIIDLDPEQADGKLAPKSLKGDIEITDLDFRYGTRELILKNINMSIKQGEKIALVGESGSGKTTLAKIILKFFNYEKGEITINNFNISDIDNNALRNKISYISQDIFLFNKSIKENLLLDSEIAMEDVINLAKKTNSYNFINELPLRFDYIIDENGTNLSMGQKQRLSILRALLRKPDILILDEATSNLDTITEGAIQNTLNSSEFDMTMIIIAHRLSTIQSCDRIYVMDKGEIIEVGNHTELINLKGQYYKLWKEQGILDESKNI